MKIEDFNHDDWKSYFAGKWSLLSASFWGIVYTGKEFSKFEDQFTNHALLIIDKDIGLVGHFRASEVKVFADSLAEKVQSDLSIVTEICNGLKARAEAVLSFLDENSGKGMTIELFKEYENLLDEYYRWHIMNKYAPEGIPEDKLDQFIDVFEEARLAAEPVFMRTEEFMRAMAEDQKESSGLEVPVFLAMVKDEFYEYLESGNLPDSKVLEERADLTVLVSKNGSDMYVSGSEAQTAKSFVQTETEEGVLKGTTAFKGNVTGTVRIIHDPSDPGEFAEGDILVAKSTRPDYLPLMNKASAFVTDAGGVLSHAAIVAREMQKPCVIGTQVATKELESGMQVEVDADNAVVKLIS